MRTNIDIDDALMEEAMKAGNFSTKRETVEAGLKMLAQRNKAYSAALALAGTGWEGDLDAWRHDKPRPTVAARRAPIVAAPRAKHGTLPEPGPATAALKKRAAR